MMRVWTQFLGTFVLIVLAAGGIYTGAYFFDIEESNPNTLAATSLDGVVLGSPFSDRVCRFGGTTETEFTFANNNILPFTYEVTTKNATGTGCANIELTATRNGTEVYVGSVSGFGAGNFSLEPAASSTWRFSAEYLLGAPGTEDMSCTFDTRFKASQEGFLSGEAFYDVEALTHTITASTDVGTSTECEPPGETVDLQMDKHISGRSNGFFESDFSFRITGEGVNAVVPHGGSIALPKGTYTIEELPPKGFVKANWRIGWYGACERGAEFTTTITIDDGNVDHSWLDCQADNQYRPELNTGDNPEGNDGTDGEVHGTSTSTSTDETDDDDDDVRNPRNPRGPQEPFDPRKPRHARGGTHINGGEKSTEEHGTETGTSTDNTETEPEEEVVLIETASEHAAKQKEQGDGAPQPETQTAAQDEEPGAAQKTEPAQETGSQSEQQTTETTTEETPA